MDLIRDIPLWAALPLTVVYMGAVFEGGFRLGSWYKRRAKTEQVTPVGAMVGVILSLAAFMLAFTFGIAADRSGDRRLLIIAEANAIGTTFLRSDFLPEQNRQEVKSLLRQYVAARLALADKLQESPDRSLVLATVSESENLQGRLWAQAVEVGRRDLNSDVIALFVDSLNNMIEIQSKRVTAALHAGVPPIVLLLLYMLTGLGMIGLGCESGLAGKRNLTITTFTILSFAVVMMIIFDLDRPLEGYISASQQPLIDLGHRLENPAGGT